MSSLKHFRIISKNNVQTGYQKTVCGFVICTRKQIPEPEHVDRVSLLLLGQLSGIKSIAQPLVRIASPFDLQGFSAQPFITNDKFYFSVQHWFIVAVGKIYFSEKQICVFSLNEIQ